MSNTVNIETYKKDLTCPKCGEDTITTDYDKVDDTMRRRCIHCGWERKQLPLDRATKPQGEQQ